METSVTCPRFRTSITGRLTQGEILKRRQLILVLIQYYLSCYCICAGLNDKADLLAKNHTIRVNMNIFWATFKSLVTCKNSNKND